MLVKDSWQYAVTSQATVPFTTDVIDMPQNSAVTAGQKILQARDLPPLSFTATRLLELSADPDVEVDDLAAVIEQDPALTARILGVANSAYFGQVNPVLSVETAIIRVLGFNMVKSLALSIAMAGIFDTSKCPSFDLETYCAKPWARLSWHGRWVQTLLRKSGRILMGFTSVDCCTPLGCCCWPTSIRRSIPGYCSRSNWAV
jgi:hypothetical protein